MSKEISGRKRSWEMNRRCYAGDFGAGNTCLFVINPDAMPDPAPLNDPKGEPSGYVLEESGQMILGRGLYGLHYIHLKNMDQFHINLKSIPTPETRAELVAYFRGWLLKLKHESAQEFEGVEKEYWFIGCPTNDTWKSREVRRAYRQIFEEAGFQNVIIVPESNAALAYYEKTNNVLKHMGPNDRLLLLDQGAYSLDGTVFQEGSAASGGKRVITSYGSCLGAGLIEHMMLRTILYGEEESLRVGKRIINMPEVLEAARTLYEREGFRGKFATYLLMQTRSLKERYFDGEKEGTLLRNQDMLLPTDFPESPGEFPGLKLPEGETLFLFTNQKMMGRILEERPVREVLGPEFRQLPEEVREELGGRTWMEAFRNYLDRLDSHYGGLAKGHGLHIMLTGGGSLMKCVSDAVTGRFKDAKLYGDKEAIFAIGKGMAYWSKDKVRAMDFEEAFQEFLSRTERDEDGDEVNVISRALINAYVECAAEMSSEVVKEEAEAVKAGVEAWVAYNCDSGGIPQRVEKHFKKWCETTGIPHFTSNIEKHINGLKQDLNRDFISCVLKPLGMKDGVQDELLKEGDKVFLSMSSQGMKLLFDSLAKFIMDHYKDHPIWGQFPNVKKKLFSDPRAEWLGVNADSLQEWLNVELSSTNQLVYKIFCELEFPLSDDFTCSFFELFLREAHYDLEQLMKERVRKILGTLVLEETIDDDENDN